ncbi:hypothetical protein ASPCAL14047 [Aspergillus calidoustus]|uniref:Uncharacterized protein n=1 Tax=Aspergillus calidoustus TaxID=454130 RepID=A0A0U5CIY6_ASPCI|nr:hypothetical protein ASPCAL14047 [Aspergillus calidoustus]
MIPHDRVVHQPLGGASYYFKESLLKYLSDQCSRPAVALHVGAQPNCAPHVGNMTTFATCFALGACLQKQFARNVRVKFMFVDSAPSPGHEFLVHGVKYQKSLKQMRTFEAHQRAFTNVLDRLSELSGVAYDISTQSFWRSNHAFPNVIRSLVARHSILGPHLSPDTGKLAIRAPCPYEGCGLADKHGVNNQYHADGRITFICPDHGEHHIDTTTAHDLERLEFNTPLRNLIRITLCSLDTDTSWIMCTGADYAGFYQEQLTWRLLQHPAHAPIIFYAPLILDWSGAKLSKSLYIKQGGYNYLVDTGRRYLLDGDAFLETIGGMKALFEEVQDWVNHPHKLFRNYTLEYLETQLITRGMAYPSAASGAKKSDILLSPMTPPNASPETFEPPSSSPSPPSKHDPDLNPLHSSPLDNK